jgi:hypothetical protein
MIAMRPGASQLVATSASSATSTNSTSTGVSIVRVLVTGFPCFIRFSAAGSAAVAATDMQIAVNVPEYFNVGAGAVKISAISPAGAGQLTMTEMS